MSLGIVWATQFRSCFSPLQPSAPKTKLQAPRSKSIIIRLHTSAQVCTAYFLVKTQATKRKQSKSSEEYIRVCLYISW